MERHTNLTELMSMHKYVLESLDIMVTQQGFDSRTVADANGLRSCLTSAQFIAAFVISEHMLGYTKQLSLKLQGNTVYYNIIISLRTAST